MPQPVVRALFSIATILGLLALIAVFVYVIVGLPDDLVSREGLDKKDWLRLKNDVRTTGVQVVGGIILGIGAFVTAWNALRTWRVTREGQITEAFAKAVELLAADELDSRLGGIYALERVARDSPQDHAAVFQVLTAYLRRHGRWLKDAESGDPDADIQGAAKVVGRRQAKHDRGDRFNLAEVNFELVDLIEANLRNVNLAGSNLRGAFLDGSDLRGANFTNADIRGARFTRSDLRGAQFMGAKAHGAFFDHADLRQALFEETEIEGANFAGARGANLSPAVGQARGTER